MTIKLAQTELPVGLRGGSDAWDQPQASVVLVDDWFDAAPPATGPSLKYWTGSAWVLKPLKRWDGSAWVNSGVLRHWDGAQWIPPISPITTEQSESLSTEAGDYIIQE